MAKYINIHTHHLKVNENSISLLNIYPQEDPCNNLFFSTGIHPWQIEQSNWLIHLESIEQKLKNPKCIAVGECGLDKNIEIPFELQKEIFEKHIYLSEKFKKPLIIHCVKAYNEMIQLKKQHQPTQKWLIHGFNKRFEVCKPLIAHHFFISFGVGLLTNKSTQNSFINAPLQFIFLETDDSNVSIEEIYQKAAELKQISIEELTLHLQAKFKKYFLQE